MRFVHVSSVFVLVLFASSVGIQTATAVSCADRVSTGDQSVGISAVEDAACANGGLGCFPGGDQCRFCRATDSSPSGHLELCAEVQASKPSMTQSPTTTGSEEAAIDCSSFVSVGDLGVGISAIAATSPTCSTNGLGCFQRGQCRFCQTRSTTQSAAYLKCANLRGSTSTPTSAPTNVPSPTAASTSTSCSSVVSRSGLQGISYVSESRCNVASPSLLGCSARTSCRLCRNYKNEANQYLVSCQVLKDQGATESTTDNSTESAATGPSAGNTDTKSPNQITVMTQSTGPASAAGTIGAIAAVAAVLVVVVMGAVYAKSRRTPLEECMTPDDDRPCGNVSTPRGGHGYTPREGSLVMVESQTSIATL